MLEDYRVYRHNPPHLFKPNATYMITGATYKRQKLFNSDALMRLLQESLFHYFSKYKWLIKFHVILPNHYHVIALAAEQGNKLSAIIRELHSYTASKINKMEGEPGRRIWWNYWDTCLTHTASYFARINYTHYNPVKHGYVKPILQNGNLAASNIFMRRMGRKLKGLKTIIPLIG